MQGFLHMLIPQPPVCRNAGLARNGAQQIGQKLIQNGRQPEVQNTFVLLDFRQLFVQALHRLALNGEDRTIRCERGPAQ
ncbi:hypothetical protein D3C73_1577280 [compost metagenome]